MSINRESFARKLMGISRLYEEDLTNAYKTFTEKSSVISRDILPRGSRVKEYLILSEPMKRYLRDIRITIEDLNRKESSGSSVFFYYAKFGGSKTQFRALLKDELIQIGNSDSNFPSKKLIFLDFPKITTVSGPNIFSQLSAGCIKALAQSLLNEKEYNMVFTKIQQLMFEIQVGIISNNKKQEIYSLLDSISKKTSGNVNIEINQIRSDLDYVQFMNDEVIIKKSKEIISILSDYQFIFVWLFDEIDQWFDLETGVLSEDFRNVSRVFHEIFELGNISKTIYLFSATKRTEELLDDHEKVLKLEESDAAITRFFLLHRRGYTLYEDGYYGEDIGKAVMHFSAMKYAIKKISHPSDTFYKFLGRCIEFHDQPQYKRAARRHINSRILKILEDYFVIENEFQKGVKLLEESKWIALGDVIPDIFATVLQYLNFPYSFERKEVIIQAKRVDGTFKISKSGNEDIYVEIKLSKDINTLKVDQILEAAEIKGKWIIYFVFGRLNKHEVEQKVKREFIRKGLIDKLNLVKIIVVDNLIAYAPMVGTQNLELGDTDKVASIYKSCASFIRHFSDLTVELKSIFIEHKDQFPHEHDDEEEKQEEKESILAPFERPVEVRVEQTFENPPGKVAPKIPEVQLSPIDKLVRETILILRRKKAIPKSRPKTLRVIKRVIKDPSLLEDLDRIEQQMLNKGILKNADSNSWTFDLSICEKGNDTSISIDKFRVFITEKLTKQTGLRF